MRKYFIEGYDKTIADNTLADVDNIGDKTQLNTAKDNLNAVLTSIKDEVETVSTKEEVSKYEESINALTTSYTNRVNAIEEAERKAELEAIKNNEPLTQFITSDRQLNMDEKFNKVQKEIAKWK